MGILSAVGKSVEKAVIHPAKVGFSLGRAEAKSGAKLMTHNALRDPVLAGSQAVGRHPVIAGASAGAAVTGAGMGNHFSHNNHKTVYGGEGY